MKKFIVLLVMALVSLTANAQITNGGYYYSFKLGEYAFDTEPIRDSKGNLEIVSNKEFKQGVFYTETKDNDEAATLVFFIRNNKEKIEEKYGIHIFSCGTTSMGGSKVSIRIQEQSYYEEEQMYLKYKEKIEAEKEKAELENKVKRINSLNDIL